MCTQNSFSFICITAYALNAHASKLWYTSLSSILHTLVATMAHAFVYISIRVSATYTHTSKRRSLFYLIKVLF